MFFLNRYEFSDCLFLFNGEIPHTFFVFSVKWWWRWWNWWGCIVSLHFFFFGGWLWDVDVWHLSNVFACSVSLLFRIGLYLLGGLSYRLGLLLTLLLFLLDHLICFLLKKTSLLSHRLCRLSLNLFYGFR